MAVICPDCGNSTCNGGGCPECAKYWDDVWKAIHEGVHPPKESVLVIGRLADIEAFFKPKDEEN